MNRRSRVRQSHGDVFSDPGFNAVAKSSLAGFGSTNSCSYKRNSAGTALCSDTQWMTPFGFKPLVSCAALRLRHVAATQLDDSAGRVFDDVVAADDEAVPQPHHPARHQPFVFRRRHLSRSRRARCRSSLPERHLARAHVGLLGMPRRRQLSRSAGGIIRDRHLQRIDDRHAARRRRFEVLPDAELEQTVFRSYVVLLRDADTVAEIANRAGARRVDAAPRSSASVDRPIPATCSRSTSRCSSRLLITVYSSPSRRELDLRRMRSSR